MKSIINGKIYLNEAFLDNHVIIYDEKVVGIISADDYSKKIESKEYVIDEEIDANKQLVVPGFIDVHIHGYKGVDTMDESPDSVKKIRKDLVENGVTSFLATTMTMEKPRIIQALENVKAIKAESDFEEVPKGANLLGVHLEGPFINKAFKGAQPEMHIIPPDEDMLATYKDIIKVVTIAPEIPGSIEVIEKFGRDICFSLGHTGATYDEAMEAVHAGACSTTHLFNAMTGLHHRKPGVVGAALTSDIYSEVIADEFHVHPDLYRLIVNSKGSDKVLLITDCMRAGGLEEGTYDLGGHEVTVANGQCRLSSGTIAGSVLRLHEGLKNFNKHVERPLEELIKLVTLNQARYLSLEESIGTIEPGKQADIVIMDQQFNISKTIVKGYVCYES